MTKGIILFAFNTTRYDYYKMAVATAKRINYFLDLPVTIVTDNDSISNEEYTFDQKIIIETPNTDNLRSWGTWINKDRFKAYELTPYDDTIILDVDYIVNSKTLLKTFTLPSDFSCHKNSIFLLRPDISPELLGHFGLQTMWATVVRFQKTRRVKQIFDCISMVQENFTHYANLHGLIYHTYRNDYALTLANHLVNGHMFETKDAIPWNLIHIHPDSKVYTANENEFAVSKHIFKNNKSKTEYILIKNMDFHMMNKDNFLELV
jgi:hypothetical protein